MNRNVAIGALAVVVALVALYASFARPHPLADPYTLHVEFSAVSGVRTGLTPVRIAGVDVGRVTAVDKAVLTLSLDEPVRRDATLRLRPRLFLEGNAFIELEPGTPSAPVVESGGTIPLRQTSTAVSFPHALSALTDDTRRDLQRTVQALAEGLAREPTAADDRGQPAFAKGLAGQDALNRVLRDGARTLPRAAVVADAATGVHDGDLRRAIDGFGRAAEALDDAGPRLPGLLAHLRQTTAAFAAESGAITESTRALPETLISTRTTFAALRAALPPTLALAEATDAALPALPAALRAGTPWLDESRRLLRDLDPDLRQLVPATRDLVAAQEPATSLFAQLDLISRCATGVLVPAANSQIEDGPRTAGTSVFSELLSAVVGLGGASQTFDGNGGLLRAHPGGGATPITTGRSRRLGTPIHGNALAPPLGTRPAASVPAVAHRPEVPCAANAAPDVNGPASAMGPADGSVGARK